jgi:hypothetical protein
MPVQWFVAGAIIGISLFLAACFAQAYLLHGINIEGI